ncbi:MAG: glycolate oxidase subunit GlcF, partial [Verrucomicrobiales bacterium]
CAEGCLRSRGTIPTSLDVLATMQHEIDTEKFGPYGEPMAEAIKTCVHCGFCLAACPTYNQLGQEMDSPRGRIMIMKEVLEGHGDAGAAAEHIDQCLGCLACEPACPSGVQYRDLISPYRAVVDTSTNRTTSGRLRRWMMSNSVPYPGRFRAAARLGNLCRPLAGLVPKSFRPMLDLLPAKLPAAERLLPSYPAIGAQRGRVALLAGCAQQVLEPGINRATIDVLTRNGVEVVVPQGQGCCGALSWHIGDLERARAFARKNLEAFPDDVDAIITNAAGCGSGLHEYGLILRGTDEAEEAERFAKRAEDISSYLVRLGLREMPPAAAPRKVAYHDACHLANAQGVRAQPRELLKMIPGVELIELADPHLCCGSAGSYNIDQPEIASDLGAAKAKAVIDSGAEMVTSGNIGCLTQLHSHLKDSVQVVHTIELLSLAYGGKLKTAAETLPAHAGQANRPA